MATLTEWGAKIAAAALPQERIHYGPWAGSKRSIPATSVGREFLAESDGDTPSSNFLYLPRSGHWKRRKGQTQQFDTFGAAVGALPAKWGAKCRQLDEFTPSDTTSAAPSVMALLTKETIASGLDDGRFSNVWVRDQVNGLNYTLGSEYNASSYPVPGSVQSYKYVPLWYDSGDGGISRGVDEFQRRLFVRGSRGFLRVGRQFYFPSLLGVPSRASLGTSTSGTMAARPASSSTNWTIVGDATAAACVDEDVADDDTTYTESLSINNLGSNNQALFQFSALTNPGVTTGHVLNFRWKVMWASPIVHGITDVILTWTLKNGTIAVPGTNVKTLQITISPYTSGTIDQWVNYNYTLSGGEAALIADYMNLHLLMQITGCDDPDPSDPNACQSGQNTTRTTLRTTQIYLSIPALVAGNRLIPSGPIPPVHAGTLVEGNLIAGTSGMTDKVPDGPISDGTWARAGVDTGALWSQLIDRTSAIDTEFMQVIGNSVCEVSMQPLNFTPDITDVVQVFWRARRTIYGSTGIDLTVQLFDGATLIGGAEVHLNSAFQDVGFTLAAAQISQITGLDATWTNLSLRFTTSVADASESVAVSGAIIRHIAAGLSNAGGWKGSDRFLYSAAYRYEDDSVWAPCVPRFPGSALTSGYNMFTVKAANPTGTYDKITWNNLPIPPAGVKKLLLLRTPKIDSTTDDNLQMNPHDLRIVGEVDAGVTTYDDYFADDDAPYLDVDKLLVREDHIMPPRARWIFGGDSRVCHSYGGLNPSAIILAPVGVVADYDLNLADTASFLYNNPSSYFILTTTELTLVRDTGAALTTKVFTFASGYATLEKLVDGINLTSISADGMQWRAQVCPGVNPQAACATALTPTTRPIASCVVAGQNISKAAGGLSAIPVGAFVDPAGAGVTSGAYVSAVISDTSITFVGTITAGTKTLTFVSGTGDIPTTKTVYAGYQRVISNSLPGFIYFNKTYLNQFPVEKSSVWMTVASPGAIKSAANCFSGLISNKHTPPSASGISMGGAGIDNGFFAPFANKRAVIRNTRDSGTGLDHDYRMFITNEASGVCGPVVSGNRCAFAFTPEGWVAASLDGEMPISHDIYSHPASDAVTGLGDFTFEAPLCIAAATSDTDTGYMSARVMKNALWVSYRKVSSTHPDRQVVYDFSSGRINAGLAALVRDEPLLSDSGHLVASPGSHWGWSVPLVRSVTQMAEGRRSDGAHLYGWNDVNAGSTGDGRIDEIETSDTDNGTAISGSATTSWEGLGSTDYLVAQEVTVEHSSPTGATVALDFHRSTADETYSLTPSTSSTLPVSIDDKMLPLPARAPTDACYLGWRQSAGVASELYGIELRAKKARRYK